MINNRQPERLPFTSSDPSAVISTDKTAIVQNNSLKNAVQNSSTNNYTPDLGPSGISKTSSNDEIIPGSTPDSMRMLREASATAQAKIADQNNIDMFKKETGNGDISRTNAFFQGVKRGSLDIGEGIKQLTLQQLEKHSIVPAGTSTDYTNMIAKERMDYDNMVSAHNIIAGVGRGAAFGAAAATVGAGVTAAVTLASPELAGAAAISSAFPTLGVGGTTAAVSTISDMIGAGVVGGSIATTEGESRKWNAALSAIGVPIFKAALSGLGKALPMQSAAIYSTAGVKYVADKFSEAVNAIGGAAEKIKTDSFQSHVDAAKFWYAAKKLNITEPQLQQALPRVQQAQQAGVGTLTAGAVTRQPGVQAQEAQMLQHNKEFQNIYTSIGTNLHQVSQDMIGELGKLVKAPYEIGSDIQPFIDDNYHNALDAISNVYDKAKNAPGAEVELPVSKILDAHASVRQNYPTTPNFSKDVLDFLAEMKSRSDSTMPGLSPSSAPGQSMTTAKGPTVNVGEVNSFIQKLNANSRNISKEDDVTRSALGVLRNGAYGTHDLIADDVSNPAKDTFNAARTARKTIGDIFESKDIVGDILALKDGVTRKLAPETIVNRVFNSIQPLENLNKIQRALQFTTPTPEQIISKKGQDLTDMVNPDGVKLWKNMCASKFKDIIDKATVDDGQGNSNLDYNALIKQSKQMPHVMQKILDEPLYNKYNNFINVLNSWSNRADGNVVKGAQIIRSAAQDALKEGLREGRYQGHGVAMASAHVIGGLLKRLYDFVDDPRKVSANLLIAQMKNIPSKDMYNSSEKVMNNFLTGFSNGIVQPQKSPLQLNALEEKLYRE